ncbi:MAG: type II toxin-antitoxin system HicB family antitoxin [Muribaculaceae bacterium]|nr:type II toxin-antitoxin system HicB family antitoxin [Muribaculaceae bacterium]MDE6753975.1 type II toxin-antitoxin system HicB family antitoxin [Muribaculaceae bacterium]
MGYLKYKGYTGSVEFSEEDDCLFGQVQGLKNNLISYEGSTIEELRNDFEESINCYLESCASRNIEPEVPFNGNFMIKMSTDLHRRLAQMAESTGITINELITKAISNELNHCY